MTGLTRWNPFVPARWEPFRELYNLEDRLGRMFGGEPFNLFGGRNELVAGAFIPPVDVYEDEKSIRMKMEVPGIEEKDINISLENGVLTVSGERKRESETKEENYHRVERNYGSFSRSFTLPNTVDPQDVNASYAKGVLSISMGTRAEARPKQIKVEIKPELTEKTGKKAA
jgi:HSP20 family protein